MTKRTEPIRTVGIVRSNGADDGAPGVVVEVEADEGPQAAMDRPIYVSLTFGNLATILRSVSIEAISALDTQDVIGLLKFASRLDTIETGEIQSDVEIRSMEDPTDDA